MFTLLDHPADIGFRACGPSLALMFEESALALLSIAIELNGITASTEYPLEASGEDTESVLVNWLGEVLWLIDGRQIALQRVEVSGIGPRRVKGTAFGEPRDPERHRGKLIVKAVTWHQLRVFQSPEGWCAEVYLDI